MACAAIVLAGGYGRRFGSDKRRWRLSGGRTLLETTLACYQGLFAPLIVVLRPEDKDWSQRLCGCKRVFAADAQLGMGHSLAAGAAKLGDADAAFIALGDMPWVSRETLRTLRGAMGGPERIVLPVHQGTGGHPVGFGRAYFPELSRLVGDAGAKALLSRHAGNVLTLATADPGVLQDIDQRPR